VWSPGAVRTAWRRVPRQYRGYQVGPLPWRAIAQVAHIEQEVFPEPLTAAAIWRKFVRPAVTYLAVFDGPLVVAYFGFEVFHTYAHVIANATRPSHRRQGLARLVLQAAEPLAAAYGARGFLGEVRRSNGAQQQVLAGIGWVEVATVPAYFRNGEDALIVWRALDPSPSG
jgi:ribosomal-protein-alanine N-acetyltransferase